MKDRIAFYLLTSLALSGVFTLTACPRASMRVSPGQIRRDMEIGKYGNVLGISGVRPTHEGYAFAYQDPKSPGKEKVVYYAGKGLSFGLKPVSLTSNALAGAVKLGQNIAVTAVVDTDDGLFQSIHEFGWTVGKDDLKVTRIIKKMGSDPAQLLWVNAFVRLNGRTFFRNGNGIWFSPSICPPPPLPCPDPDPPDPNPPIGDCPQHILKIPEGVGHVALAMGESSSPTKLLLRELIKDHLSQPEQTENCDVVLGLRNDSRMSKGQSLTLTYVYRGWPEVKK